MVLPTTINKHVTWDSLARLLGLPNRSQAFPTKTDCPFCGGARLNVYQDNISGGAWHYCFDCKTSGDMIELAAKVWDISPQAAVTKLASLGIPIPEERLTPEEIAKYVKNHPQRRRRMDDFWRKCSDYLLQGNSKPLAYLRDKFCLKGQLSPDRWMRGPGHLVGGANALDIEYLYRSTGSEGPYRIFVGKGWTDVLVFPYHIAPDRLSGFLFVGREGGAKDRVFKSTWCIVSVRSGIAEAGLFGLHTVQQANRMFGQYCFAVDDPLLAMRMQIRHFAGSDIPLPLVSWYDAGAYITQKAWCGLERQQVIFWGFKPTPSMINQARLCDGYLSIVPLYENNKKSIDHYIRLASPADLFRRAVRRAMPWRDALVQWASKQGIGAVEELVIGLERYGVDIQSLTRELGYDFEGIVSAPRLRVLSHGVSRIIEHEDGWYFTNKRVMVETLLSEAKLRIDEVISGDNATYRGVVQYKGKDIPFVCDYRTVEKDAKKFIIDTCMQAGVGRPQFYHGHGRYDLLEIALGFHKPTMFSVCEDKPS